MRLAPITPANLPTTAPERRRSREAPAPISDPDLDPTGVFVACAPRHLDDDATIPLAHPRLVRRPATAREPQVRETQEMPTNPLKRSSRLGSDPGPTPRIEMVDRRTRRPEPPPTQPPPIPLGALLSRRPRSKRPATLPPPFRRQAIARGTDPMMKVHVDVDSEAFETAGTARSAKPHR